MNAERAKLFHVSQIRRILKHSLIDELGNSKTEREAADRIRREAPDVVAWIRLQLLPRTVMTAWTLGPRDKAEVVGRFLIELGLWDRSRRGAQRYLDRRLAWHRATAEFAAADDVVEAYQRFPKKVEAPNWQRQFCSDLLRAVRDRSQSIYPVVVLHFVHNDDHKLNPHNLLRNRVDYELSRPGPEG